MPAQSGQRVVPPRGENIKRRMFTAQRGELAKRLRPDHRNSECPPSPPTHGHHILQAYVRAVPFTWHTMSDYQEKFTRHTRREATCFEETEQKSEPDIAGM